MRDIKTRAYIIWCLLTNNYTRSTKFKCMWLPTRKSDLDRVCFLITLDPETYYSRGGFGQ